MVYRKVFCLGIFLPMLLLCKEGPKGLGVARQTPAEIAERVARFLVTTATGSVNTNRVCLFTATTFTLRACTTCIDTTIITMLAARDQENLVHGRQTAAASKPLNQGVRQLQPKTPGNKAPKTPFKIPLNDENANNGLGPVKGTAKATGAGKNAFVTPSGK